MNNKLLQKAQPIQWLLTDNDGVLTDGSVYYGAEGEMLKKYNLKDGMAVERLNAIGIQVGIISGETSPSLIARAKKLNIIELHLGIKDKKMVLDTFLQKHQLMPTQIAYIGDDTNDLGIIEQVGLSGCPIDAINVVKEKVDFVCQQKGGEGAFREFAELIIAAQQKVVIV